MPKTCGKPWRKLQVFVFFFLFLKEKDWLKVKAKSSAQSQPWHSNTATTRGTSLACPLWGLASKNLCCIGAGPCGWDQTNSLSEKTCRKSHRQRAGKVAPCVKQLAPRLAPWVPSLGSYMMRTDFHTSTMAHEQQNTHTHTFNLVKTIKNNEVKQAKKIGFVPQAHDFSPKNVQETKKKKSDCPICSLLKAFPFNTCSRCKCS